MDLIDRVRERSELFKKKIEHIQTEEATKSALVMPFISNILGYNVFDPTEVVPEYAADIGKKKGEKVDYAILVNGKPVMLMECKKCNCNLDEEGFDQLKRYYHTTEARFGVLTDGLKYRFYTDLDKSNIMDDKPFFEFDMLDIDESLVEELKKFTKDAFDLDNIVASAGDLKYVKEIKRILADEWGNPSDDFVKYFASRVYEGKLTQAKREQFVPLTKKALQQFLRDRIYDRLQRAQEEEEAPAKPDQAVGVEDVEKDRIDTTEEELEAYYIVKAILCEDVGLKRIAIRDRISYCNVLLDNNQLKPICRFHFNNLKRKSVSFFVEEKKEEKIPIESTSDLYKYSDRLKKTVAAYDSK